MKTVYITGISGFIGSNIANKLFADGYTVEGCDNLKFGYAENLNENIKWHNISVADVDYGYVNSFDCLVIAHCDNLPYSVEHPIETFKTNSLDTINLINKYKGDIVYLSTSSTYGMADEFPTKENADDKCTNAYDTSKLLVEKYLEAVGGYTTLKLTNVYGKFQRSTNPYCGVLGKFIQNGFNNEPMNIFGDGSSTRDYTHVSDVIEAVKTTIDSKPLEENINIGTQIETSTKQLAQIVSSAFDKLTNIRNMSERSIDTIVKRRCLDITKAKELLGWTPTIDLEAGIRLTIEWMKSEKAKED